MLFTLAFFKGAAERAIKTGAQTLAGYFVIGTTGVLDFDWVAALSVTAAAMVASLVTSRSPRPALSLFRASRPLPA
jgi:hypothetical protein